jgi:hypothetical protein
MDEQPLKEINMKVTQKIKDTYDEMSLSDQRDFRCTVFDLFHTGCISKDDYNKMSDVWETGE